MPKPNKTNKLVVAAKQHKLLAVLLIILLLVGGSFGYNKYLDWDNAQTIKGLSRDFPQLIEQVEQATGLDLEIESNCMTTQEKFSSGVSTCEYSTVDNQIDAKKLAESRKIILESDIFGTKELSENSRGYRIYYRNKNSCTLSNLDRFYISCIVGVRDANKKNLSQLLN